MFARTIIWATQLGEVSSSLWLLNKRIVQLTVSNGWKMAFMYLKECVRLSIRALGGTPEAQGFPSGIPRVKRDPSGLPTIIPLVLRQHMRVCLETQEYNPTRAVLTLLSSFRVFPVPVKADLGSVITPFDGLTTTLADSQVVEALKRIGGRVSFGPFIGFVSESAGPNGSKATWSSAMDALAFLENPRQLWAWIRIALITRSYGYLAWIIAILAWAGPVYVLSRVTGRMTSLHLGRLGVVYDQAGKARVVGITNWWTQLALRPLHRSIFGVLKKVPMDGTFDQLEPLRLLTSMNSDGHSFHSFDLTAATDRLPVDLQVQILRLKGLRSDLWKDLLSCPYWYNRSYYKYAVGQPMGAYSSWAMLSYTHHVIVQVAAVRVGLESFNRYALLGDDIVIYHDAVATEYAAIMKALGVGINASKSLISKDFCEFAKRWVGPGIELSPIGAGVILQSMRRSYFIGAVLRELFEKGYASSPGVVRSLLRTLPSNARKSSELAFWTCFGLKGFIHPGQIDTNVLIWCTFGERTQANLLRYSLYNAAMASAVKSIKEALQRLDMQLTIFYLHWWRMSVQRRWSSRLIEAWAMFLSPGVWLTATALLTAEEELKAQLEDAMRSRTGTYEDILDIVRLDPILSVNPDWWDRKAVRNWARAFERFDKEIWRTYDDMTAYDDPYTGASHFY